MPTIIDVEASGFGASSYPIEVGVIKASGERYCSLIKPLDSWTHWDEQAQQLHGLSRTTLLAKGRPVQQVCFELNQFLAGQVAYSDGWVVDQPWLIKLYYAAQMSMTFTVSPLELLLTEPQMALWQSTKQTLVEKFIQPRHRASHDAALIQNIYRVTRSLVADPAEVSS